MLKMLRIKDTNIWYPVQKSDNPDDSKFSISYDFLQQMFYDSYLEKINEHHYPSDLFAFNIPNEIKGASELADRLCLSISTSLRRIRRSTLFRQLFRFRVIDDFGHAVYIQIRPFKDDYDTKPTDFLVSMVVADDNKMTANMFMMKININSSKGASIIHGAQTGFFCVERSSDADKEVHDYNFDLSSYYAGPKLVCMLERCLYLSLSYLEIPWKQWNDIKHTDAELMLLRNIIQREYKDCSTHCVDAWGRDERVVVPKTLSIPSISRTFDTTAVPKIDFNAKEWKFVSGYCIRNNLLGNETHVDLHKYLDKPRYGKEIKIPISCNEVDEYGNENVTSIPVVVTYEIDDEDSIVMFISETVDENTYVIATVASRDISDFNLFDNLVEMQKIIVYNNPSAVRRSLKELSGDSMLAGAGANGIGGIMRKALEVFIVIQDRPERSRMVKCTETKKVKVRQSNSKKKRVEERSVTWRVLKPFKEAKEYVEKMTAERRDAEYTIEEWERQGHLRTYKSGKTVWIETTTCHRRKPLSDKNKEISIKL